jgi:hypothetical protein
VDAKQGVRHEGAERVFHVHDFDKESAERYNVKMTGHKNVERVSVSRMNEEAGECVTKIDELTAKETNESYGSSRRPYDGAWRDSVPCSVQHESSEVVHGEETSQLQVGKMA